MAQDKLSHVGLNLPHGLVEIGYSAFSYCQELRSLALPYGLTALGRQMVVGCPNIQTIYFPETVELEDLIFTSGYSIDHLVNRRYTNPLYVYALEGSPAWEHIEYLKYVADSSLDSALELLRAEDREKEGSNIWLKQYGEYLDSGSPITYEGKLFVFTGIEEGYSGERAEHALVQAVLDRGALYRSSVSGKTDYLIVNPAFAGHSKIKKAIEMKAKGRPIQVILQEELIKDLEPPEPEANIQAPELQLVELEDCVIEDGTLLSYTGPETDIILPKGITAIGEGALANQLWLRTLVLPDGILEIGDQAFADCPSLEEIYLPDSIRAIGRNAFSFCVSLEYIKIPSALEEIADESFLGCQNLKTIILQPGIKKIGNQAFAFCNSLTEIGDPRDTFPDMNT